MDNIKEWTYLSMPDLLKGPPAENTGRGSVLNRPSCPPNDPISQRTELNSLQAQEWGLYRKIVKVQTKEFDVPGALPF